MQACRYLFIIMLVGLSQNLFAASPVFGTAKETSYARSLKPPKGKSIIYIYQRPQQGGGVSPEITLNNYKIGRIVPGSFTVWQLAPGKLRLQVAGSKPTGMSLSSRAGKTYLFRISVSRGSDGVRAELVSLPESYRGELEACRLIKNPRKITPQATTVARKKAPATNSVKPAAKPARKAVRSRHRPLKTGGIGLALKLGSLGLSNQTQNILGQDRIFEKNTTGLYGFEGYFRQPSGLALGGELLGYKAHFVTSGLNDEHEVSVLVLLATAKQYYMTASRLQPYLGAGLGVATTSVSGPTIQGNTVGYAYQLVAGAEYRFDNLGLFAEARYLGASTKDSKDQKIDVGGSGFFAGLAYHY